MAPFKALGIDEIHAKFYQVSWAITGESVYKLVINVYLGGTLNSSINKSLLVLIPKNIGAKMICQLD